MNADAEYRYRSRKRAIATSGLDEYRLLALQRLKLKTVIKESHCTPIRALKFNHLSKASNLFATVGGDQATVYDGDHLGDYVGIVVRLQDQVEGGDSQEFVACAWVDPSTWTLHPHGDCYLAVADKQRNIQIISIVEARVIARLEGHMAQVVELASCLGRPEALLSLARDGEVHAWSVPGQQCVGTFATGGATTAFAVHPSGKSFTTAGRRGALVEWSLCHLDAHSLATGRLAKKRKADVTPSTSTDGQALTLDGTPHAAAVDCMRFLDVGRLATKSVDGHMAVWRYHPGRLTKQASWKVPGCSAASPASHFGATPDGAFLCAGDAAGKVSVYAAATGARVAQVSPIKVSAPVRACALSHDCRHLLAALGNGFVFRFECADASFASLPTDCEAEQTEIVLQ